MAGNTTRRIIEVKDASVERHDVIVIGAGQTGLAAAYELAKRGIEFVALEASPRVGDVWRRRYDSLLLYSPARGNDLPGHRFPLPANAFPTGRQMGDYLEAYAAHHRLPVRAGVRVDRLSVGVGDGDGSFNVMTPDVTYLASQVIVATGAFQRPRVPDFADQLDPGIRQLHAADYHSVNQLADGPVLVVGVGHSGADLAHEIARAGHHTILSGRAHGELPFPIDSWRGRHIAWPLMRFVGGTVLTLGTPIGRRMAPGVRAGGGPLLRIRRAELRAAGVDLREERTVGSTDGRPVLSDGTVLDVANVLWCTGFRPDYSWIEPSITDESGWPVQYRGVVDAVPGLYVMGIPFLFGFTSMLVAGAARDARYIVERVAELASERSAGAAVHAPSKAM
jgi:putative flavoprotein involved in K+ transport